MKNTTLTQLAELIEKHMLKLPGRRVSRIDLPAAGLYAEIVLHRGETESFQAITYREGEGFSAPYFWCEGQI